MSPTARTLAYLRKQGHIACVVEKWNQFSKTRNDAFGIADILSLNSDEDIPRALYFIQATSGTNHNARIEKVLASKTIRPLLESGAKFQVISWAKKGPRGERKLWTKRISEIKIEKKQIRVEDLP